MGKPRRHKREENSPHYMKEIADWKRFLAGEMKTLPAYDETVTAFLSLGMFRDVRELITLL